MNLSLDVDALRVIEDLATQVIENKIFIEHFLANSNDESVERNSALACLARSLDKTADTANGYAAKLASVKSPSIAPEPIYTASHSPLYYPTAETLGDRIKSMRELRNLGQFHLASSVGVTRSCIEAWEENTTIPASDKIIPLASALNCDPMWLLTGGDSTRQASTGIGEQQHHHVSRPADDLP